MVTTRSSKNLEASSSEHSRLTPSPSKLDAPGDVQQRRHQQEDIFSDPADTLYGTRDSNEPYTALSEDGPDHSHGIPVVWKLDALNYLHKYRESHSNKNPPYSLVRKFFKEKYNRGIGNATVRRLFQDEQMLLNKVKNGKQVKGIRNSTTSFPMLEDLLKKQVELNECDGFVFSQDLLTKMAMNTFIELQKKGYYQYQTFDSSSGWLEHFRRQYTRQPQAINGSSESGIADLSEHPDFHDRVNVLREVISEYDLNDVYTVDEIGLFWRLVVFTTDAVENGKEPVKSYRGNRKQKDRICLIVCCNFTGTDRIPLTYIGTSRSPRCFQFVNEDKTDYVTGLNWKSQGSAWVNTELFSEWLLTFNDRMKKQGRSVLLLMDNFIVHNIAFRNVREKLTNVRVECFPNGSCKNTQPLDQGIISFLKASYRWYWVDFISACRRNGEDPFYKVTLLNVVEWITRSWNSIPDNTIVNCFTRSIIFKDDYPLKEGTNPNELPEALLARVEKYFLDEASSKSNLASGEHLDFCELLNPIEENTCSLFISELAKDFHSEIKYMLGTESDDQDDGKVNRTTYQNGYSEEYDEDEDASMSDSAASSSGFSDSRARTTEPTSPLASFPDRGKDEEIYAHIESCKMLMAYLDNMNQNARWGFDAYNETKSSVKTTLTRLLEYAKRLDENNSI